jgi:hypothetical protein
MADSDVVVVLALCGSSITILYVERDIPFFAFVEKPSEFSPTDLYEMSKGELSAILIPALPPLYPLFQRQLGPVDVLAPLQIVVREAERRPFFALIFLGSPIVPFTAERAAAASRTIAVSDGVVHIGATEHFKRLTALARHNFGIVFGLSEIVPSVIKKLLDVSSPIAIKLFCPRFLELEKVTGGDGTVRSTTAMTVVKLKLLRGCSGRLAVDYSRITSECATVKVVEVVKTDAGRYLALHSFTWPPDPTSFAAQHTAPITQNLVLKGFASDVLRAAWDGGDWETARANGLKAKGVAGYAAASCVAEAGGRPDREALRLFFVLECLVADLSNRLVEVDGGHAFVAPPVVYLHCQGDPAAAAERVVASEWPFEVRVVTDRVAFRLVVEKLGGTFE